MATSSTLKEDLNCSICLSIYRDPVFLDCMHNFCRECIEKAWKTPTSEGIYSCPMCNAQFSPKPEIKQNFTLHYIVESFLAQCNPTVEGMGILCDSCLADPLPAVKTCIVCEASLCEQHLKKHNERPSQRNHSLVDPTSSLGERKCSAHDKIVEYYCSDDDTFICVTCYVAGSHKAHNIQTLKDAYIEKQGSLSTVRQKLLCTDSAMVKALEDLKIAKEKVKKNNSSLTAQLSDLFEIIIKCVKKTEKELFELISSDGEALLLKIQNQIQDTEKGKRTTAQLLKDTQKLHEQSDAFLFIKDFKVSQEWISKHDLKIKSIQILEQLLNKSDIAAVIKETDKYSKQINTWIKEGLEQIICSRMHILRAEFKLQEGDVQFVEDFDPIHLSKSFGSGATNILGDPNLQSKCTRQCINNIYFPQVTCSLELNKGRHYWDTDTQNGHAWAIGIVTRSKTRHSDLLYIKWDEHAEGDKRKIDIFEYGKLRAQRSVSESISRIRVQLDYKGGTVSFYKLDPKAPVNEASSLGQLHPEVSQPTYESHLLSHLYTFYVKFLGPVTPAFSFQGGYLALL